MSAFRLPQKERMPVRAPRRNLRTDGCPLFWHLALADQRTLSDHCDHCGNERNWRCSWSTTASQPQCGDAAARKGSKKRDLMGTNKIRTAPTWSEVKAKLALFDRAGLVGLLSDLHSLSRDNQAFLHARLGLGPDPLAPYKATLSRWLCPDVIRGQAISVARAKKAISDYRKAIGLPAGVAELSVFYCESAARLLSECAMDDEGYFAALVRMFDQALVVVAKLNPSERRTL